MGIGFSCDEQEEQPSPLPKCEPLCLGNNSNNVSAINDY